MLSFVVCFLIQNILKKSICEYYGPVRLGYSRGTKRRRKGYAEYQIGQSSNLMATKRSQFEWCKRATILIESELTGK